MFVHYSSESLCALISPSYESPIQGQITLLDLGEPNER
jgi:hypothetical protein